MRHRNLGLRKVCGCPRRQWGKCRHDWHFSYQWKGTRYRISLDREIGRPLKRKKTEAVTAVDEIRTAIRAGTFRQRTERMLAVSQPDALTLDTYAETFLERYSQARGKTSWTNDRGMLNQIRGFTPDGQHGTRFGSKVIRAITEDDVETFIEHLRTAGRAAATRNQYLQLFRAMSAWGVRKGYLTQPWIGPFSDLKREKHARRQRRVNPDEETALLQAASTRLYRLLVAAVETGCRQGELLSLQWVDVYLERRELRIRAVNAKNREDRFIPISSRLLAILEMARYDPAGAIFGPQAYVFGDQVGRRVHSPKKAWETTVLKAHGHKPRWTKRKNSLAAESRIAFREIDLHFHDLRHEAGSRWLEKGMPLHHIKELLGPASISTTDTYLNAGRIHLQDSMRRLEERGKSGKQVANDSRIEPPLPGQLEPVGAGKSVIN